jgi:hypothetical protein
MKRARLPQRVRTLRQQQGVPSTGGWRLLEWIVGHELAFILCGGLVFGLLMVLGHAARVFFGPASEFVRVLSMLWLAGIFLLTVLVMDDNPKYRKSGAWICAAAGAVAGAAIAWLCSAPAEWIATLCGLGALLGVSKPVWLLKLF